MRFKFCLLSGFYCLVVFDCVAQVIESNSNREKIFAFEVKMIDEFFERFNNNDSTLITSYVKLNYPGIRVDRQSLLSSLFNRENLNWEKSEISDFFNQVNDSISPVYLDFYSDDWYAEASCKFRYKGKITDVVILLKIQTESNGGCKWVIVSAYCRAIPPETTSAIFLQKNEVEKFLNPMSHATNFIALSRALNDKSNIGDYLDSNFIQNPWSRAFLRILLNNQLQYQFVKDIKYHFLQVNGWIFTVNHFHRNSVNSGWLISKLSRATDEEKDDYKQDLFRSP